MSQNYSPIERSLPGASLHTQPPSTAAAAKPKRVWVRIAGIPSGWKLDDIPDVLQKIDADFDVETQLHDMSIFPACFSGGSQVALCELDSSAGIVQRISSPDINYPRFLFKRKPVSLVVDRHFYDLTPLNAPEEPIVADVIAVTGLAGHAFGSWKSRESGQMWLKDFLPEDIKRVRVMTYGYNSNLIGDTVRDGFLEYRQRFIQSILNVREGFEDRPIIFCGHSMGGILILQALLQCKNGGQYGQLFNATRNIFFFGTPHQGMEVTQIISMIEDQDGPMDSSRRKELVEQLRTGTWFLDAHREDIIGLWKPHSHIEAFSFYETRKTRTVAKSDSGVWGRTGDETEMVAKNSAQLYGQFEHRIPVDADHTDIAKFPHRGYPVYRTVVRFMNDCIKKIG